MVCDTPGAIKRMLPGIVLALRADDLLLAEKVIAALDGVIDVQPYGDVLNIIVPDESFQSPITTALSEAHVTVNSLSPAPPRLEEVFIYFVRQYRTNGVPSKEQMA